MDRRSWLWRRKSSDKSSGETESSGSVSSHSERYSDDQEAVRASPFNASPNYAHSPEVSSDTTSPEVQESVKSLNEKLSAALLSISAKEGLVKQHAKVTEEAVSGWEKAENEVAALKKQLEAATQRNSSHQERIDHLDGALKECIRQLRQSREEQEQKAQDTLTKKTKEWQSNKFELETRIIELQAQLEARKSEATMPTYHDLKLKIENLEMENSAIKVELLARSEDLQMRMIERELSTQAAEAASKQHLESIKKVAKLEAECRRLQAAAKKSSPFNDFKPLPTSTFAESVTDSQSDGGERLFGVDNDPSCSDSWSSVLISEVDHFKNDKILMRDLTVSTVEIDLMDDFLEMERLAALPETKHGSTSSELDIDSHCAIPRDRTSKAELKAMQHQVNELEEKVEKMTNEKTEMGMALAETRNQLKVSCDELVIAEDKLAELQRQLNSANGSKHSFEIEVEDMEAKRKELELQLKTAHWELQMLHEKVNLLEQRSAELASRCKHLEDIDSMRKDLEAQLKSANLELRKLHEEVGILEGTIQEERALSAKLSAKCQNMEANEIEQKNLQSQLKLTHLGAEELRAKMSLLEGKLKQERILSAELGAKVESVEAKRKQLNSELESAHLEHGKLREKIVVLESKLEEERNLSSELAAKCQNLEPMEAKREALESQLNSAHLEIVELCEKLKVLEGKVEEERELQSQLELAHLDVRRLHEEVSLLEREVEKERTLSTEFAAKCQVLEMELRRKKLEREFRQSISLNGELKINKVRELAMAAGKLADCQKTIASLNRQLKSLTTFEDFMLETEKAELNVMST